jgi:drug/metabolite transporter (DMT)-like permease
LSPDSVLAIFGVTPLVICVLAVLLLKERPTAGIWGSAAIISAGAMLCLSLQGRPSPSAMVAALTAAGSFSLYVVMTRMLRGEGLRANLFYTALGVFAALSLFVPGVWITPSPHDAVVMVLIGAFGLLALLALDRAAASAPVSGSGAMVDARLLVPIGGVLVGRQLDLHILIGAATIGMGMICAVSLARNPEASAR